MAALLQGLQGLQRGWSVLVAAALLSVARASAHYPNTGIHNSNNKIVWTTGCCDGDLVVIDFRDEMGDGNQGSGLLTLANSTSGEAATYEIAPFHGMWRSFGPFCAPAGTHSFSFTSDSNPTETTFSIVDSFGLVRGRGGMDDMPVTFNTSFPSRFCFEHHLGCPCEDPDSKDIDVIQYCVNTPCVKERRRERARKVFAYSLQFKTRSELTREGLEADSPYTTGYSVLPPPEY